MFSDAGILGSYLGVTLISTCSVLLLLWWNTPIKATWGGKGLFGLHFHITVHHQRKSGQELKQDRNLETGADAESVEGCDLTGLLLAACSACFLVEPKTTSPRMASPTMGQAFPHPTSIKKMFYRLAFILRHFLEWGTLLFSDSSLCHIYIKLSSTKRKDLFGL